MIRFISTLAGVLLLLAIVWAIGVGDFAGEGAQLLSMPWGIVTLVDLYAGFILTACIIWVVEPRKLTALLWALPIFFLGNIVSALWLVLRGIPRLRAAFR